MPKVSNPDKPAIGGQGGKVPIYPVFSGEVSPAPSGMPKMPKVKRNTWHCQIISISSARKKIEARIEMSLMYWLQDDIDMNLHGDISKARSPALVRLWRGSVIFNFCSAGFKCQKICSSLKLKVQK